MKTNNSRMSAMNLIEFLCIIAALCILGAVVLPHLEIRKPQATVPTSNNGYDVKLLFMIDGLKVYRFLDAGVFVYVVDGRGSTHTITTTEDRRPVDVETITK